MGGLVPRAHSNRRDEAVVMIADNDVVAGRRTAVALAECSVAGEPHMVHDGLEALEFAFCTGRHSTRTQRLELIFLDAALPLLDGMEVLRRLKNSDAARHIPVMVTGPPDEDLELEALSLGAEGHVPKPVRCDSMAEILRNLGLVPAGEQ